LADHLWKLASRAATLAGVLESRSRAFERLVESGAALRAEVERRIEALAGEASAESRHQVEELRAQRDSFDEALNTDLRVGHQRIEAGVREALECEKAFAETARRLAQHLRDKPECRELLEAIETRGRA
jgi:serine/threonine-protein kinase